MQKTLPKSYAGVDIFKFFFAVCVVLLHTHALDILPATANYMITKIILRLAVPYFFIASGFFLGKKLMVSHREQYAVIIRGYCLRLLKPLVFFEIISLAYCGFVHLHNGMGLSHTILDLGRSILFYPYGALWYVQACIIGTLLLYPFLKRDRLNLAIVIGLPLYGFALIANNYSFLIENTPLQKILEAYMHYFVSARNGLFTGFLMLAIGILCSRIHQEGKQVSRVLLLIGFVLYIAEILFIYAVNPTPLDDGALYITHLFFIPVLFLTTLRFNPRISPETAVLLRNLSTGIYFLHRPVLYVSGFVLSIGWLNFLIVLSTCLLICGFVYKTRMKFLYSLLK